MMKKGYARGGMKKKMMMAGGASMKKKMMSKGGKMPMNPATGKPTFVGDGIGKMAKGGAAAMYKKGYAAGGAAMKKKMMSKGGGATSDYDITERKYGGAGKRRTGTTTKAKKPVVTKAMMAKAGVTSLRDFYNKMEVNAAGTGYKKRSKALTRTGAGSRTSKMNQANPKLNFGTKKPSKSQTKTMKPSKPKKKAGPLGFQKFFEALSKRGGFRSD